MSYRHVDEIDHAVHVARKALSLRHLRRPEHLTRFLYQRWYLGLPSQQAEVPAQRSHVWQAWSKEWTEQHARADQCASLERMHAFQFDQRQFATDGIEI